MVIYRLDYEQRKLSKQITVPKNIWKVKPNGTPLVQMKK